MPERTPQSPDDPDPKGGLGRLVELEARVARELEEARAEAARIVAAAKQEALRQEQRVDDEVEKAVASLESDLEAECRRAIETIGAQAEQRAARYERAGSLWLDALASEIVLRVLEWDDDHQDVPGSDPGAAGQAG